MVESKIISTSTLSVLLICIPHAVLSFVTLSKTQFFLHQRIDEAVRLRKEFSSLVLSSSSDENEYDLAIIGAGPVGVQSALDAASSPYNKKVCLIDAPRASGMLMNGEEDLSIGGPTGLFSKALRDTSKSISVEALRGMGLREKSVWNEIISNCIDLASANAYDVKRQLEFAGVTMIEGLASFPDSGGTQSLFVTKKDLSVQTIPAKNVLIASGSKPFRPGGIPFDGKRIFDSDSINQISYLPKSIAITGSGIIAIEYAKIFRNLGSEVTLIIRDRSPRNALTKIGLDKDVASALVADLTLSGIKIERGAQVSDFYVPTETLTAPIRLKLEGKNGMPLATGQTEELLVDAYLAAVGRKPNTGSLNLGFAGIDVDEYGGILVDSNLRTSAKAGNVYSAGDVLGRPFLASTGVAQGRAALVSIFGSQQNKAILDQSQCSDNNEKLCVDLGISSAGESFDPASLAANPFSFPTGVWSSPEAAFFGLSKQQAEELGMEAGEGMALYAECLRGRVFSPNGLLKLVFEKSSGRVLGVHIVGDDACELIHYGMELVKARRTIEDVINSLYTAVTYHEMYKIAAQAALDEVGARKRRSAVGSYLAKKRRSSRP
mmetsp:Transcript_28482/g.43060  ORF Transcript_28482/g.43060 Transcript_28482/m.43060 type:complete len:605 (-) Transcript_28482:2105-3919(-)